MYLHSTAFSFSNELATNDNPPLEKDKNSLFICSWLKINNFFTIQGIWAPTVSAIQKYRPQKTIGYKNQFGKVFVTEYLCSNIQLVRIYVKKIGAFVDILTPLIFIQKVFKIHIFFLKKYFYIVWK
jgi:hypothetical protein